MVNVGIKNVAVRIDQYVRHHTFVTYVKFIMDFVLLFRKIEFE